VSRSTSTRSPVAVLAGLVVMTIATGCLSVAPAASPTLSPSAIASPTSSGSTSPAPSRSRRPRKTPGATPTNAATATATSTTTTTEPPTEPPTLPVTEPPTAAAELDWALPSTYGDTALTAGFTPDPHSIAVTGGGPVGVSYLGGDCVGWATAAPSYSVAYTSGSQTLLRFYYQSELSRDAIMVVNDPLAEYHCNDDSFGSVNPSIDFSSPSGGTYDIWVGALNEGTDVSGTLYVTEIADNHPVPGL
jgi:hypothetical protein